MSIVFKLERLSVFLLNSEKYEEKKCCYVVMLFVYFFET